MLAAAAYFHHPRFFSLFAVFATILASLFSGTITGGMSTVLKFLFVCHLIPRFQKSILKLNARTGKLPRQVLTIAAISPFGRPGSSCGQRSVARVPRFVAL